VSIPTTATEPRFVEPDGAPVAFRAARDVLVGLASGAGATLGLVVVVGLVVEEVLVGHALAPALDLLARRGGAVVLALGALLVVGWPLVGALERAVLLRRLERRLEADPRAVALGSVVERVATAPSHVVGRLVAFLGVAAAGLGVVLAFVAMSGADETTLPLLGFASVVVLWLAVRVPLRRATGRWEARVDEFRRQRDRWAEAARTSLERRRHEAPRDPGPQRRAPWSRALGIVSGVAAVLQVLAVALWFVPVRVRYRCRTCEPRTFGPVGEERMDALTVGTTAFLAVATALLVLVLAARLLDRVRQDRVVARWAATGPWDVPDAVAEDLLGRRAATSTCVRVLAGLCPLVLTVLVAATDPDLALPVPAPAWAAALPAVALGLALVTAPGAHRRRAALRHALLAGDDVTPQADVDPEDARTGD